MAPPREHPRRGRSSIDVRAGDDVALTSARWARQPLIAQSDSGLTVALTLAAQAEPRWLA
jgi:hypothetical protein